MNKHLNKMFSVITILALMLVALPMQSAQAVSTTVVISQVYGGGGFPGAAFLIDDGDDIGIFLAGRLLDGSFLLAVHLLSVQLVPLGP